LKVTDAAINDLWLAQGEALKEWNDSRNKEDIAIVLNTGAGKTLVGLLVAQSLVNEIKDKVIYACSSIQLVQQTAQKAKGYGLDVTTYFNQKFSNELYHSCNAPCITTYQALFNGRSRFFSEDVKAVVFDDAHTVEHLLRDQFTVTISREEFNTAFLKITELFKSYYTSIRAEVGYVETIQNQDKVHQWFVPPFIIKENIAEFSRILIEASLNDFQSTRYTWAHIKDSVDLCAVFITSKNICITPPFLPNHVLPYFGENVRRIYLSGTIPSKDVFFRAFGRVPEILIEPKTTAGKCERMILVPDINPEKANDVDVAKKIIKYKKTLIIVPTYFHASKWNDVVNIQQNDNITEKVEDFKNSVEDKKLLLVGRYDGVDLPGDTCRIMVIDELPSGVGPLEKYLWEKLGLNKSLRSTIAARIVQSFGRISRGMSDHGVIILTGAGLTQWLLNPKNKMAIPNFLRCQLELGMDISRQLKISEYSTVIDQCLAREQSWTSYYEEYMEENYKDEDVSEDEELNKIAEAELKYAKEIWNRNYIKAVKSLETILDNTFETSRNTGAWHCLWIGYGYELINDNSRAYAYFQRAHGALKNIPPYERLPKLPKDITITNQVLEVARYLDMGTVPEQKILARIDRELVFLNGGKSSNQEEEAVRALGELLGLNAVRPDHEFSTGPDVLW
jgi:hypothetical protein